MTLDQWILPCTLTAVNAGGTGVCKSFFLKPARGRNAQ
jgi:hypothetical protein